MKLIYGGREIIPVVASGEMRQGLTVKKHKGILG